ncbi:MAG: FAD-binding protein, partial [Geobacteraceae bacterium]|nr:FAD-binding protein [Geobacteraceae bacterium]
MPFQLLNFAVDFTVSEDELLENLCRRLLLGRDEIIDWRIIRKGLDARKKSSIRYVYTIEFSVRDENACRDRFRLDPDILSVVKEPKRPIPRLSSKKRIVIVGTGPAGLFAAIRLSDHGLRPVLIERGRPVEERVRDVESFWRGGVLNPESNVQFGEGGAGTFSDG